MLNEVAGADSGPTAVQFNMYGYRGGDGFNGDVAPWTLAQLLLTNGTGTSPIVWAVSLNEVCWTQWLFLWTNFFAPRDFQAQAYWTKPRQGKGSECGPIGNTVSVRGTSRTWELARAFSTQGSSAAHGEQKGFVCLQSNYYGQVACSAHTQAADTKRATAQLNDMDNAVNWFAVAGVPMLLMGDYNAAPSQSVQISQWKYQVLIEADKNAAQMNSKRPTTDQGKVFDYIFRRAPNSRAAPATIKNSPHSDHHYYVMHL